MTSSPPLAQPAPVFGENDAAVFETFVVPTYLRTYWEAAQRVLLVGEAARVVHLGCRTGFPDAELLERMPRTTGVGVDSSAANLTIARGKLGAMNVEYREADPTKSGLPGDSFSHALALHPVLGSNERIELFREMNRLLYPGGQAIVALPLSRSFPEILDLLAEYALKHDDANLIRSLEMAASERVTIETLSDEIEAAGLSDIDFELFTDSLGYDSGRALVEDPATRFLVAPQIALWLEQDDISAAMEYVGRAIDKYWSEDRMELSVTIAAISARR